MSEIRLVAVARDVDATGEAWIRPVASVDWHEAFRNGITAKEAQELADSSIAPYELLDKLELPFKEPVPEDSPDA